MKKFLNKTVISYLGPGGVILILLSGAAWLIQMKFGAISAILSIVGLACILIYVLMDFKNIPAKLSKRSVKYGTNTVIMIVIVLGIVVLVEAISSRHNFQLDLTSNQRFTLSDQTRKILNVLEKDVNVLAFFSLDQGDRMAFEGLLRQYASISPKIAYEFVDPDKNPGRAKSYEIQSYGTIVLETEEKQARIVEATEDALTNALIKVTREGKKVVYFLKGHGERGLEEIEEKGFSQVKQAIESENYEIKELLLMQEEAVPADAALLIIAGPQKDLLPAELEVLKSYIQQAGKVLFMLDPDLTHGMSAFLQDYGITLGDDMVIDRLSRIFGAGYDMPVASEYQDHPITENFNIATFFPIARSVRIVEMLPDGVSAQQLLNSSSESWAETNKEELQRGEVKFDGNFDLPGPVPLAAVVTLEIAAEQGRPESGEGSEEKEPAKARLVVFGDSDFASNTYLGLSGNADLFLNTVNWLAEEEDLVAIRAKDPQTAPLMLTAFQGRLVFFLSFVFLPLFVAVAGVMIYVQRRNVTR